MHTAMGLPHHGALAGPNDGMAANCVVLIFQLHLQRPCRRRPDAAVDDLAALEHQIAAGAVMADRGGSLSERIDVLSFHDQQRDVAAIAGGPNPSRAAVT